MSFLLCEILNVDYQSEEFEDSFELCLRYCVNSVDYANFNKKLGAVVNFKELRITASKFRLALRESGYTMSCLKFFVLHLCKTSKALCEDSTHAMARKYKVYEEDAEAIYWILGRRGVRASIANSAKVKVIKSESVTPEAYFEMCDTFTSMIDELNTHAKRAVRKLSFVVKSENFDRDEFTTDLVAHALKTHYYYSPNEVSYEHHLNRLRASMSNHRINMIKHYTSESRQRLVNVGTDNQEGAVFVQRTSSESQMRLSTGGENGDDTRTYDEMGCIEPSRDIIAHREFSMSIDQLLHSILACPVSSRKSRLRKSRLLLIVVGRQVDGFDRWLRKKQLIKADIKTGVDFIEEKTRDEFMPILSEYLNVPVDTMVRFLVKSAKELAIELG